MHVRFEAPVGFCVGLFLYVSSDEQSNCTKQKSHLLLYRRPVLLSVINLVVILYLNRGNRGNRMWPIVAVMRITKYKITFKIVT